MEPKKKIKGELVAKSKGRNGRGKKRANKKKGEKGRVGKRRGSRDTRSAQKKLGWRGGGGGKNNRDGCHTVDGRPRRGGGIGLSTQNKNTAPDPAPEGKRKGGSQPKLPKEETVGKEERKIILQPERGKRGETASFLSQKGEGKHPGGGRKPAVAAKRR